MDKQTRIDGFQIESYGKAPWQVDRAKVTVSVFNPALKTAKVLDANGNSTGALTLKHTAAGVELNFPETAMYVVLQSAG
jgi:hypothetical protein